MADHALTFGDHPSALLSAFLDDELDDGLAAWVTRHLARCVACLEELEQLRAARSALRGLPDIRLPESLLAGVATAAEDASINSRRRRRRLVGAAATCGVVGGVLGAAFVVGAPDGTVTPPVDRFVVDHVVQHGGGAVIVPVNLNDR